MSSGPFSAVILAAGYSSRMGRFKPLLPLAGTTIRTTIIQRVISIFQENSIKDIELILE